MKHFEKIILSGFLLTVIFTCFDFTVQSENISESLIRLHVKANSDDDYDQEIKLIVKDEVNEYTGVLMNEVETLEQAQTVIYNNIEEIEKIANEVLLENETDYVATVSFTEEYFPTREYETFTLPAGNYMSLKIEIGEAQGSNWWCVVYPSLCTSAAIDTEISEEQEELITDTPKISFKIYEIYMDIVNYLKGIDVSVNR